MSKLGLGLAACVVALGVLASAAPAAHAQDPADFRAFAIGAQVPVRLNESSFASFGYSTAEIAQIREAMINALTRWNQVGGANVTLVNGGATTSTSGVANEITVIMNAFHCDSPGNCRFGSRFGGNNPLVVLHRRDDAGNNFAWNFWGDAGGVDFQGVLTHEIGHALGLEHAGDNTATMHGPYGWTRQRLGPHPVDRTDLIAQYGVKPTAIQSLRSTDNGGSWAVFSSLPGGVQTTMDPGAFRAGSTLGLFYTGTNKNPCFIFGTDTGTWNTSNWFCYGGSGSRYGMAADGDSNEAMFAWVDNNSGNFTPTVHVVHNGSLSNLKTTGGGVYRDAPGALSTGTPAIVKVGADSWVLAYSRFNSGTPTNSAVLVARVTTNDGVSWGPEVVLNSTFRSNSGVSATVNRSTGALRFGFSRGRASTDGWGTNTVGTLRGTLSGSTLTMSSAMTTIGDFSRNNTSMARSLDGFHEAHRDTGGPRPIRTRRSTTAATTWADGMFVASSTSYAPPAVSADPNFAFVFLYRVFE